MSALMDNQADDLELRRLLKDLPHEPELAETWKRFHVARSVLHNEEMVSVSPAATSRIFAAIAAEPAYEAGYADKNLKPRPQSIWLENVGRVAIAASVALAAFMGLQSSLFRPSTDMPVADTTNGIVADAAVQIAVNKESNGFDAEAQRRLNDYIRGVSIQYGDESGTAPEFNILQDSQLIRQVNQIELQPDN
ncbi:MAG: sigma-E factor negative regulatory protein [Gammaproteobacteria bacterium]|nr:sigma-E factor negative regulatory protein [Gammaproteobacteria bacterium]MDP2140927.1 sigma-E factor negative regulatory protein [Gammaproteobacteria bacterium]MDP2349329.1 sigma-E factor negative regulatory protein [Gammaproteobacteria bacterium]